MKLDLCTDISVYDSGKFVLKRKYKDHRVMVSGEECNGCGGFESIHRVSVGRDTPISGETEVPIHDQTDHLEISVDHDLLDEALQYDWTFGTFSAVQDKWKEEGEY
jgi:hypothetical protein